MTYAVVSNWTSTEPRNDEMAATAQNKFVPAIKALGALHVFFISTGEKSFRVASIYPDQATADAASAKQAELRSQAKTELPVSMVGEERGEVFAQS